VSPAAYVDAKTGIALVRIPAGEFLMGDESMSDAQPVHRVRIAADFYLGKYPVTNEEYGRFLKATGYREPDYWSNRRFSQPQQPVAGVSWDDAQAFCRWAGGRLPTEAQWEYACRAGTTTAFSFSDDESRLGEFGWYDKNSGGQTQPVGGKAANPWGLYDVHGNVWEWCQDWYDANYYRHSPKDDPPGPKAGSGRVLRGGSWLSNGSYCRSGFRSGSDPPGRYSSIGFRLLCR
jgi:formylglycine-generating enzyme required for sulfatase activity